MERYNTLKVIGQGSFGKVHLVQECRGKGRKLVLKQVQVHRMEANEQAKVSV